VRHPLDFPLLSDENIHRDVVAGLRSRGRDVVTVVEGGMAGQPDIDILRAARNDGRTILTHDSDFGDLAIRQGEPWSGIIHLRPGHISSDAVLSTLDALGDVELRVGFPFLLVAARRGFDVKIRLRLGSVDQDDDGTSTPGSSG